MNTHPVIIIGGGLGGLAASCTLAARGHRVTLLETNHWLGGKAASLEVDGFRFDMGPTILTVPSVLRRIFAEAGRSLDQELDLVRLDPQWRSFFSDGKTLDLLADVPAMARRIDEFSPGTGGGEAYKRLLAISERQNEVSHRVFFYRSIGGMGDFFKLSDLFRLSALRDVLTIRLGQSYGGLLRSHMRDPRVSQMLDHFTQYVGSAPDSSPAVLWGIAHMQTGEGVWYPRGGIHQVPQKLRSLALELGVEIRDGVSATRIVVENGRATAVETSTGESLPCSAVVSNRDTVRTHRELLDGPPARAFARRRGYEPACSGVVLYLGLKKRYDHLLHHNFVFSRDAHEEFESIYRKGEPAPDPTCYVCAPAQTDPTVAPEGGEALYILVHTPYLRPHHDWSKMLPEYRKTIFRKLADCAGLEDLESRIVVERTLTPADIHRRYQVLDGAIYGIASHGRINGALKPANRSPDVRGLYFAGGSAHPGPGMPMALMSGWIAADVLDQDGLSAKMPSPREALSAV